MSEHKHSPSPWRVSGNDGIHDANCITIAAVLGHELNPHQEANARLIAAAPELLEALITCVCLMEHEMPDPNLYGEIIHKARAAIAKATGTKGQP